MDPVLLEALQKHIEGVIKMCMDGVKAALQESEANMQNTLNAARE